MTRRVRRTMYALVAALAVARRRPRALGHAEGRREGHGHRRGRQPAPPLERRRGRSAATHVRRHVHRGVAAAQTPDLLGVQRSAVGTVRRADGATQLTLGGAPLYRHAGPAPAQPDPREFAARGWFVVNPSGQRVT